MAKPKEVSVKNNPPEINGAGGLFYKDMTINIRCDNQGWIVVGQKKGGKHNFYTCNKNLKSIGSRVSRWMLADGLEPLEPFSFV